MLYNFLFSSLLKVSDLMCRSESVFSLSLHQLQITLSVSTFIVNLSVKNREREGREEVEGGRSKLIPLPGHAFTVNATHIPRPPKRGRKVKWYILVCMRNNFQIKIFCVCVSN